MARLTPGSIEEAQALLAQGGRSVLFVGGGTALPPGPPAEVEISSEKLSRIVEYEPADQVVTAECGVTLAQLQGELAKQGQRLALDPPQPSKATVGGIVAANSFGPLRTRFGSVRDLIIGISIVRADGTRAKGGGKVVKTVAGFDLPKLMCGSQGSLAFIATATFRVHPLPEKTVTVRARGASPLEMVRRMRTQQLEPAAMVALGEGAGGWDVYLRFEGFGSGVRAQLEKLRDLEQADWPQLSLSSGPGRIRFGALPTQVEQVTKALLPLRPRIEWLPTLGLGFASAGAPEPQAMQTARRELIALGGWMASDGEIGPPLQPAALALHKAVKKQFDPAALLAPGRFFA